MNKVIELRKAIVSVLKEFHTRIHYQHVPENTSFPYIVYDLPNSIDDGSTESFVLDIDGWDKPLQGDTTLLETLMDQIDKSLNKKTILINNQLVLRFFRSNRLAPIDDDKRIIRRKYIYEVKLIEGRQDNE